MTATVPPGADVVGDTSNVGAAGVVVIVVVVVAVADVDVTALWLGSSPSQALITSSVTMPTSV
jgi:hypothetical protein